MKQRTQDREPPARYCPSCTKVVRVPFSYGICVPCEQSLPRGECSMTRQTVKDRDYAIRNMTRLGITPRDQARLLRLGATLHRLAEAECSGYWPCDNGERTVRTCGLPPQTAKQITVDAAGNQHAAHESRGCGAGYVPGMLRKTRGYLCPSCCAEEDAGKIAASYGLRAVVNGDPRGGVLYLVFQDASREDVDSGRVRGEYVR